MSEPIPQPGKAANEGKQRFILEAAGVRRACALEMNGGRCWIRTSEGVSQLIYSRHNHVAAGFPLMRSNHPNRRHSNAFAVSAASRT
jgi:hypothetical protein